MVCVVARQTDGTLTSLVKQLDERIAKDDKLKGFVVVLTDDEKKTADELKKLAAAKGIRNVPLTLIPDTKGPDIYQIAKDADVTVMMWRGTQVKANRAYKRGSLTDEEVKAVLSDVPKILGD